MVRRTQRLKGGQQPVAGDVGKNNHKLNLTTLSSRKYRGLLAFTRRENTLETLC